MKLFGRKKDATMPTDKTYFLTINYVPAKPAHIPLVRAHDFTTLIEKLRDAANGDGYLENAVRTLETLATKDMASLVGNRDGWELDSRLAKGSRLYVVESVERPAAKKVA